MSAPVLPHVTLVHAGQSHSWADWMDAVLAGAGAETRTVRWDPLRQAVSVDTLEQHLGRPDGKVLLVLDDWFLRMEEARREAWSEVLRTLVPRYGDRIAAVTVTASPLPGDAELLSPVMRLRGVEPRAAAHRLLDLVGVRPEQGRAVDLERAPRFPDDVHAVHNAPRHNPRFTGREAILAEIHDLFADGGSGSRVALHAPGGFGKTQVAIEYVHRYAGEYDIVWWVGAASRLRARTGFAALADELGIAHGVGKELRGRIEAVKEALSRRGRRWLMVLDGAESPEDLASLLPDGPGHLLITSPQTGWSGQSAELIELPPFEREESVAFALQRTARLTRTTADALAEAVQDVPLLLDQTAAWLDTNVTEDVNAYVRGLSEGDPNAAPVMASRDYEKPFQAAWSRTVNTLKEREPTAYELLCLLAFFSPDVVPVRLLRSARAADLPHYLAALVAEPSAWNRALRTLSESTSMRLEYEMGPRHDIHTVGTLRMHRLFHRFIRNQLPRITQEKASAIACRVLVAADPRAPLDAGNWARYAELIPHLEVAGALTSADPDVRVLVLNCIEYLRVRGEHNEGLRISKETVRAWSDGSDPTGPDLLVAEHQLAIMQRRLGCHQEAEFIGRRVLAKAADLPQERAIEIVRAKNGLGGTLMALGRYDEARALLQESADLAAESLGEQGVPRTLSVRGNLAIAIGLQGRYHEAYELHRDILGHSIRLLGGKHHLTLHEGLHTAWTLRLLGRYRDALDIQEHNSRLHAQVLDRNHSQSLLAQHNLALCKRREGDLDFARVLMREVRDRLIRQHGPAHHETLLVSSDFAMLLRELGDLDTARSLAEDTLARFAGMLGPDHPYTAGLEDNCALIQRCQGAHRNALERAERARERMEKAVGADHVWAIACAMNTASARSVAGDPEAAVDLGRTAMRRAAGAIGEGHVLALNLAAGLSQDLRAIGRVDEAETVRGRALALLSENLDEAHPQVRYMLESGRPYWDFEPQTI